MSNAGLVIFFNFVCEFFPVDYCRLLIISVLRLQIAL